MKTIEYNPDGMKGFPIADGEAKKFVLFFLEGNMDKVTVSTSNVITVARVLSLEGDFEIQFEFQGQIITPNKYGAIHDWPKGFCDLEIDYTTRILKFAMEKRKAEIV